MINFTHLNVHSEYSFVDSIIKTGQIINYYNFFNFKTICITDLLTMSSFYEYYFYCYDNNIKPLIGIEGFILINGELLGIILLAKNFNGYKNLMNIVSYAWKYGNVSNGVFFKIHWIINNNKNLFVIINPRYYLLKKKQNLNEIIFILKQLIFYFEDNIFFEHIKINLPFEKYINNKIFFYSKLLFIKLVSSNSVKFLNKEDYAASLGKVLLNKESFGISEIFFEYTSEQYLKNYNLMKKIFVKNINSILNVYYIIKNCNINFKCYNFILPNIKIKKFNTRKKIFYNLLKKGLKNRILKKKKNIIPYLNRINKEIIIINNMGLLDYFLIIYEFILWSKKKKISSGPGRGSGASSLTCYLLYITDIDPVNENLLFERFLTSERLNLPDLDLDFCVLERDSLINHMFDYYEYTNTSQIITFHNLSIRSLIRNLSRAIGLDYVSGDRFSKTIPFSLELCMEEIFKKFLSVRSFISSNEKSLDIWKISTKIEGIYSSISKHAGGVVISKNNIFNTTPILIDGDDCLSQYEKNFLQEIGLLKFDFLGLKTITIINFILSMIPEKSTGEFNIDDYHTYQMINNLETDLVFQIESHGIKKMIKRCPINNIFDIITYLSLFRPGPIHSGCLNIFLNRKNNLEKIYFPYKEYNFIFLKDFLYYTHGIIIFQEQVIAIIQTIFESTAFDAEKIFLIMISNSIKELDILFKIFEKKSYKLKITNKLAFFYLIVMFAGYSFNRTHAHSYAKIVYQTAFLKANYLLEFCLSNIYVDQLLGIDLDRVIFNLKTIGIFFYKPDINISNDNFKIYKNGILFGFSVVKFIDEDFIDKILYYRNKIFFYNNFETFCKIFSIFKINNKKIIENLIFCGFFDCFRNNRMSLYINFQFLYEKIISLKEEYSRLLIYKMINLLDYTKLPKFKENLYSFSFINILNIERKLYKFYISNIPSDYYFNILIGQKFFNLFNRLEKIFFNIIIAVPKKKMYFEKKLYSYRIYNNEKITNVSTYSKFTSLIEAEVPFVFIMSYDLKDFKTKISKYYHVMSFIKSIGIIYLLLINNIFFLNKIIKFLFNNFNFTGGRVYFIYKNKKFISNFFISLNENFLIFLKNLNIIKYFTILINK